MVRGGAARSLPAAAVVPGDLLECSAGEKVPADAYVLDGSVAVDQSILTGESGSVDKVAGQLLTPAAPDAVAQDKHNILFSGSLVTSGRCAACNDWAGL